jgi:glycosyltransferase involved in cell wall biosynthesis
LKILFSTDTIVRGGKERQLFILTRALFDKGNEVIILTRNFSNNNYLNEYNLDKSLVKVFKGDSWYAKYKEFKKIVISEDPDILISWDLQTSLFSFGLNKRIKCINASIRHGIRLKRFSHLFRSMVCHFSPYIIANSYAGLKANNLKPGKSRFVLYNGIESRFKNNLTAKEVEDKRIKKIPGYSEKPGTVFITVANLVPFKDYFTVLKAMRRLKEQYSFYYFIIGDGQMREQIVERIKQYGLEKKVFLTGNIEDVSLYLFISDIMIHSSRGEGISNSILEGMFSGLPIIATNVGGIPETVYPESSLLFNYKKDKVLFDYLIKGPSTFKTFDRESEKYKNHLDKFSIERMLRSFEEIIGIVRSRNN